MTSEVLDTISVKETYETTNGQKKTRTTNIKAMVNNGSEFINIHSGRGSVCISKGMIDKVSKAMTTVKFTTQQKDDTIESLKKKIAELEKKNKK